MDLWSWFSTNFDRKTYRNWRFWECSPASHFVEKPLGKQTKRKNIKNRCLNPISSKSCRNIDEFSSPERVSAATPFRRKTLVKLTKSPSFGNSKKMTAFVEKPMGNRRNSSDSGKMMTQDEFVQKPLVKQTNCAHWRPELRKNVSSINRYYDKRNP